MVFWCYVGGDDWRDEDIDDSVHKAGSAPRLIRELLNGPQRMMQSSRCLEGNLCFGAGREKFRDLLDAGDGIGSNSAGANLCARVPFLQHRKHLPAIL